MSTSTSTTPQGSSVEFRPLALTINALTLEGKAVTKAVWDQIPTLVVKPQDPMPEDVELLGWVAVGGGRGISMTIKGESRTVYLGWPFIGVRNGEPVRVEIAPAEALVDPDATEALTAAAVCWLARCELASSESVDLSDPAAPPPFRGMGYTSRRGLIRVGGPETAPTVDRWEAESQLPSLPTYAATTEAKSQRAEVVAEWANLTADELEALRVRIVEGIGRAQTQLEERRAQRAAANALPQLYIAVGGKVR